PESPVLPLPMPNVPDSIARFHGALRHGAVVTPINPLLSEREATQRRQPFDPAPGTEVVLYTSGTTGDPKRVELPGDALLANAEHLAREAFALSEDDVLFGAAPLSHVFGMTGCMNATIVAGAMLALVRRFDALEALEVIEREDVTVFMGVPAMLTALLTASTETGRAPQMRLAHVGAAPFSAEVKLAFEERFGATVLEGYGMTEAGGAITAEHIGRPRKPGSVGTAVAGQELRIADDGEVLVDFGGRCLATGDLGRLDDEGYLYLLDRKKDVILRGGYTVYPRQVEEALLEHPAVREAVVVGVPHAPLGEEVAALVVPNGPCDPTALKAFVRDRVAAYAYPRLVVVVDDLPRTGTGKVLRRAIDRTELAELLAVAGDQTFSRPT
ncbi:MAG: class I adenylate-forming enzyme family protein, partial [Gaiellaceae bacterium]